MLMSPKKNDVLVNTGIKRFFLEKNEESNGIHPFLHSENEGKH